MFDRILVAFDGSTAAQHAFALARDLAEKYAATMRVIAIARPPDFGDDVETEAVIENSRKHYQHALQALRTQVHGSTISIEHEILVGHPAQRIVLDAEQWGAKLIVLGHAGHGLMSRWLVGSVAKQMMHHATCAVLIAR